MRRASRKEVVEILSDPRAPHFDAATWEFRKKVAAVTETIPFGCEFICGGREGTGTGCCQGCPEGIGWWLPSSRLPPPEEAPKIARYWQLDRGFWRPKRGCALPRPMRSTVCLVHFCGKSVLPDEYGIPLNFLSELSDRGSVEEAVLAVLYRSVSRGLQKDRKDLEFLNKEAEWKREILKRFPEDWCRDLNTRGAILGKLRHPQFHRKDAVEGNLTG